MIETGDSQFHRTPPGGDDDFDLNYSLQAAEYNAHMGSIQEMLTVRNGPFGGP